MPDHAGIGIIVELRGGLLHWKVRRVLGLGRNESLLGSHGKTRLLRKNLVREHGTRRKRFGGGRTRSIVLLGNHTRRSLR